MIDLSTIRYAVVAARPNGERVNLENVAENIAWEENEKELAVRLNLTLRDIPYEGGRLSEIFALGTEIYLYADWGDGQREIFRGTVWTWEHSHVRDDAIILTCYDVLYYLQKSTDNRYFPSGKTTKEILTTIFDGWSVQKGDYTGPDMVHQKIVYSCKTVAAMITATLDEARKLGSEKSIVRAREGKVDIVRQGSNSDIYDFTTSNNLISSQDKYSMTDLVTRVIVLGKEDTDGRPRVETCVDGKTEYGTLQACIQRGSSTLDEASKEAKELLDAKGKPVRIVVLNSVDFPLIRKGDLIHAKADRMEGYFYVKGISHNATNRTMRMEVEPRE